MSGSNKIIRATGVTSLGYRDALHPDAIMTLGSTATGDIQAAVGRRVELELDAGAIRFIMGNLAACRPDLIRALAAELDATDAEYGPPPAERYRYDRYGHARARRLGDAVDAVLTPYVVSDSLGAQAGGQAKVMGKFATEADAARFISTLPHHLTGRYNLDGPPQ